MKAKKGSGAHHVHHRDDGRLRNSNSSMQDTSMSCASSTISDNLAVMEIRYPEFVGIVVLEIYEGDEPP